MTSATISLKDAGGVVDAALARGREIDCAPLTVAVLDAGGHLVVLKREDRSGILRPDIAVGKAWGALGMRLPSRNLATRAEERPQFFTALAAASGGRLVPVPGGVLIRQDGEVLGAVGITGDTSDNDEDCAVHGVRAVGLDPDTASTEPH
ncbi:MAG: heme-binding protein [Nitriliruptorales bacterium]|nr:heme-binding protein [Nitriliruptorales bacterium]